jgi:hypothetical protein
MAYTPPDYGGYGRQKADVQYKYGQDSVTNAYGRFISQQRGERGLADSYRGYQRQFPQQTSQFGQRGLSGSGLSSGVMQNSMNNFVGDFARDYGRQQQDLTQNLQQFDLGQVNLDSWRQQQMQAIEAQKQRDIANDAAQLDYLRQMVGGL